MSGLYITPTEALLQVAKQHPSRPAVKSGEDQWSYGALWTRVRHIADEIADLGAAGNPVGLYMGLEIDYVAAAHAIWLAGLTVMFLSAKWSPEVLQAVIKRANVNLVLFGHSEPPVMSGVRAICTFNLVGSQQPPSHVAPPSPSEAVEVVPLICCITTTSGTTGVPKSIVYPMRRSLQGLSEESSTLFQPMDGQWLRGGSTFLRPLFEIRRFMFNQTTLYLDSSTSVADQCIALCKELESPRNSQLLRVQFTSNIFRAFADLALMHSGQSQLPSGFNRVYWMVLGGESLSIRDLELARMIFPSATFSCSYACSEVGFAGISQMFVRPADPMPSAVSYSASYGCTGLVLLDESLSVIPKTMDGATGIIGIITSRSATHYLDNEEASRHMFRPWKGDDILLYTDDIGCMQVDGTIVIRGRSSRNVKINGLFVDLDYVEHALAPAFTDKSFGVTDFKLVKSNTTEKIVLFANTMTTDALSILKHARDCLRASLTHDLAKVIGSVRCITEMPFNASDKIDLAALQKMADSTDIVSNRLSDLPASAELSHASEVDFLAEEIAVEIAKLSKSSEIIPADMPLLYSGLNSITMVRLYMWLQSEHEYAEDMTHLFDEEVTTHVLATEILKEMMTDESDVEYLADEIAARVAKLSKSLEPVPKDVPLLYSGLNSITLVRLYMWLQSEYEYEEEMTHLFDEEVTAEVLAMEILGHDDDDSAQEDSDSDVCILEEEADSTSPHFISVEAVPELHIQVNEDDSDSDVEDVVEIENGWEVVMSPHRQPKSPLFDLKTPLSCNFPSPLHDDYDVPESPFELSPFSVSFSAWALDPIVC